MAVEPRPLEVDAVTAVTELELRAVDLPFRHPFRHAAAERTTSESLFVRMRLDNGVEGWGECLPRSYVSGESRADAFRLLRDAILPAVVGISFSSLREVTSFLERCDGKAPPGWVDPGVRQSSAWSSVDLALLDAFGRSSGGTARSCLGGPADDELERTALASRRYSGVVSAGRSWRDRAALVKVRAAGFRQVKVKLEHDGAVPAGRMARRALGRRVDVRVDANMAWDVDEALEMILALQALGIDSFEQPVRADDIDGLARLVRETSAGIIVDEGFTDRESLQRLISRRACTGVNVRISKCGGLVAARARCREALDAGLVLQLGCQVGESSLLSSAHVALLSALTRSTPGVRYAEGCFGRHLLREDPVAPSVQFGYGGRPPRLPAGPGLGVCVNEAKLQRWTVEQATLS